MEAPSGGQRLLAGAGGWGHQACGLPLPFVTSPEGVAARALQGRELPIQNRPLLGPGVGRGRR